MPSGGPRKVMLFERIMKQLKAGPKNLLKIIASHDMKLALYSLAN